MKLGFREGIGAYGICPRGNRVGGFDVNLQAEEVEPLAAETVFHSLRQLP
jgi:hypothetical protein